MRVDHMRQSGEGAGGAGMWVQAFFFFFWLGLILKKMRMLTKKTDLFLK